MVRPRSSVTALPHYFSPMVASARRFYLRGNEASLSGLSVAGGGVERCRPDYRVDRAEFPYPTVELVASGAGTLVMQGKKSGMAPGTVLVYGKGVAHRMECDPDHPLEKYFVVLRGTGAGARLRELGLAPGAVLRVGDPGRVRAVFDELIGFGLGDRADRGACCAVAAQYLLLLIREQRTGAGTDFSARAFATYERCRRYMQEHGKGLTSTGQVASACHVDPAYMCRLFQRFGRERPGQALQHLRMNHAMTQLQTTERLIKDIAAELGYEDPANFTRAFRGWFGVPPQTVRGQGAAG